MGQPSKPTDDFLGGPSTQFATECGTTERRALPGRDDCKNSRFLTGFGARNDKQLWYFY
jgi:hypothetical protein